MNIPKRKFYFLILFISLLYLFVNYQLQRGLKNIENIDFDYEEDDVEELKVFKNEKQIKNKLKIYSIKKNANDTLNKQLNKKKRRGLLKNLTTTFQKNLSNETIFCLPNIFFSNTSGKF